jgi:hypothetical protein
MKKTLKEILFSYRDTFDTSFVLRITVKYVNSASGWMKLALPIRRAANPWMLVEIAHEKISKLIKNEK